MSNYKMYILLAKLFLTTSILSESVILIYGLYCLLIYDKSFAYLHLLFYHIFVILVSLPSAYSSDSNYINVMCEA